MGKKKGLAAMFSKPKLADGSPSPPWPWPSCANNPQTASFHRQDDGDDRPCTTAGRSGPAAAAGGRLLPRWTAGDMYKTVNSVYLDPADSCCFSLDYDEEDGDEGQGDDDDALDDGVSYSTTTASEEWSEAVIRSLGRRTSTDRFFFDSGPPPESNSILAASRSPSPSPSPGRRTLVTQQSPEPNKAPAAAVVTPDHREGDSNLDEEEAEEPLPSSTSALVEESVAVALDSEDPYGDFRASMEEMVAAHGLRDWSELEELLSWYLRINGKHNHALIVGAFVDLLVGLASTTTTSRSGAATTTTTTTVTMTTTATATSSSSSTSSSVAGDGATCSIAATTTLEEEQCGGGGSSGTDASCSPTAASSDQEEDEEEPDGKKKASDDELATLRIKLRT